MTQLGTIIGPSDHGRRMTLEEFEAADSVTGTVCELSRGVVVVTDVPNPPHMRKVARFRNALILYFAARPEMNAEVLSGSECRLAIESTTSERHPDLAVYKLPAPAEDSTAWASWIPELLIEVVSSDSAERDYVEKPEDYLEFGAKEYVIVDESANRVRCHTRSRGRWKVRDFGPGEKYVTPQYPGFELDVSWLLSA
jgi:Uma2 family endonuclease